MRAAVQRHEWLQKHPTPANDSGDFHWYPGAVDPSLRAELAELARGDAAVVWHLEPGRVAWAVGFSAVAPADRRRYGGLAVSVIEAEGASAAELLALVTVLPAEPWAGEVAATSTPIRPLDACASAPRDAAWDHAAAAAAARALWHGGAMRCATPAAASGPRALATLDTWLASAIRDARRTGTIAAGEPEVAAPLFHYLGRAWALPGAIAARDPDFGRRSWRAALELAARGGVAPEALFAELEELVASWRGAGELGAYLDRDDVIGGGVRATCARRAPELLAGVDAGWLWNRVLHYWGRGLVGGVDVEARLASVLTRRIVADHLVHLDQPDQPATPLRYWRRLRWEALLPRRERDRLAARVRAAVPALVEVARG